MPSFKYKAVDPGGKVHKGVLEASSAVSARQQLRQCALLPIELQDARFTGHTGKKSILARKAIDGKTLSLVTRQLATLIASDIRIEDALRTVAQQQTKARIVTVIQGLRSHIVDGYSLANALGQYPGLFPEYYRASVLAGEQSGQLGNVLLHLADFVETRQHNRHTLLLALLYPALLAVVSIGIIILLLTYVMPDIVRVFISQGAELPILTRALMQVSDGLNNYGLWTLLSIIFGVLAARYWLKKPDNKNRYHRWFLKNRLTAKFTRLTATTQFAGTLATLLQSGVPLVDALHIARAVTPNMYLQQRIQEATSKVQEGQSLRTAIQQTDGFPPMLVAMIASGESSGQLAQAVARAANDQQRNLDTTVKALVALVEPAVLLVMGGLVMLLVMAILLPIVTLNNLVG